MKNVEIYTKVTVNNAQALLKAAEKYPTPANEQEAANLEFIIKNIRAQHDALPRKRGNAQVRMLLRFAIGYLEDAQEDYLVDCLTKN